MFRKPLRGLNFEVFLNSDLENQLNCLVSEESDKTSPTLTCQIFRNGILLSEMPLTMVLTTSSAIFTVDPIRKARCLLNVFTSRSRATSLDSRVKTGTNPCTTSLEASIEVGRQQLQEYQPRAEDNHDNDNQVTRYVVAEPGQEFCVVVKRDESFLLGGPDYDVMCYLFIDGKHVWGIPIRKEEMAYYKIVFTNMKETLADGRRTKRNFLFSELMFGR